MDSQELQKVISPNIYDQRNISHTWMKLWNEIENWFGDAQKRESGQEFLERLQNEYNLRESSDGKLAMKESTLPISGDSGMCQCDNPEDAGNDYPDVFHKCTNCGKSID